MDSFPIVYTGLMQK